MVAGGEAKVAPHSSGPECVSGRSDLGGEREVLTEKASPFPALFLFIRRVGLEYPLDVKTLALPARGGGIRTRPLKAQS